MTELLASDVRTVVGVGFGPSNLALAIALSEADPAVDATFLERQPRFGWHRGMLIAGATLQVSFLKDLASMRDPRSAYTFTSYLHARGRLPEFINSKTLVPSRVEFHDYLEWAAADFASVVRYGTEVVDIRPVHADGRIPAVEVVSTDAAGRTSTQPCRNVVISTGLVSTLPPGVVQSARVRHACGFMDLVDELRGTAPRRLVVVGAGQSAAEATECLHREFPSAEVCSIFSRVGYSVADDSPFANAVFNPEAVDVFHAAPDAVKRMVLDYHANTNYSVVDVDLTEELYRRHYQELVTGRPRLHTLHLSRITALTETPDEVRLEVEFLPTGGVRQLSADAVVFATGYRASDPLDLLGGLAQECKRDADDRALLDRSHRVVTSSAVTAGIFVQGAAAEATHGLASGLLSTTAVRAGEITATILGQRE